MNTRRIWGLLVLVILGSGTGRAMMTDHASSPPDQPSEIRAVIHNTLERSPRPEELWLGCELIHTSQDLIGFYNDRDYQPVWVVAQGVTPLGKELVKRLQKTDEHGLNPEDYHLSCITGLLEFTEKFEDWERVTFPADPDLLAQLDILLTDGFLVSLSHLATGRVSPETLYTQWLSVEKKADILSSLQSLKTVEDLQKVYEKFYPSCRQYEALVTAGIDLREIVEQGGRPLIPEGPALRRGDTDRRVLLLRRRLDHDAGEQSFGVGSLQGFYDHRLEEQVKRFQRRHGLDVDGVVGSQTIKALNVPARKRWQTVLVNLERLRWLSCDYGNQFLLVNIADFTLQCSRKPDKELTFKVIVGKEYQKTPVFRKTLRYIVLNPYWNVPRSIAVTEILPKVQTDPDYLSEHHLQVLSGWKNAEILNPDDIDWSMIKPETFQWRFRQEPGPWNSLGRIKFIFPNQFHVYIHDTPNRELFKHVERAFSHGCIRVQHPLQLAAFILDRDPEWTADRLEEVLASQERTVVIPSEKFIVDLTYVTAWIDDDGVLHFRRDVYDRDQVLWKALQNVFRKQEPPLESLFQESPPQT